MRGLLQTIYWTVGMIAFLFITLVLSYWTIDTFHIPEYLNIGQLLILTLGIAIIACVLMGIVFLYIHLFF